MTTEKKKPAKLAVQIPIRWRMSDSIVTRFASNVVIQTIENEFKVSFFEIKPEIRLPPSEEVPHEVLADCVASVIITADRMPKFINVLQTQLDAYNERRAPKLRPGS